MFSIGTFSKINKITTKTLRHYDEIGLLKPDFVDQFTGYRYYTSDQLPRLHKIMTLKQMGLALNDIKEALKTPEALEVFLRLKEQDILNQISEEKSKLMQIRSYFNLMKGAEFSMYSTAIKPLPEVIVASMRQVVPSYETFFDLLPNVMAKEMQRTGCVCAVPEYCFNIYHDGEYKDHDIDVEICEAITQMKENTEILKFKVIPEVPLAACVLHKGPYETLMGAYSYIFKWLEENQYEVVDLPRESFIDGIWNKESSEDWLTEIQVPVKVKI